MDRRLFIRTLAQGHSGYGQFGVITSETVGKHSHTSYCVDIGFCFSQKFRSRNSGTHGKWVYKFAGNCPNCFPEGWGVFHFTSAAWGSGVLHILTNTCYYLPFSFQPPGWAWSGVPRGFWFAFLRWLMGLSAGCLSSLGKCVCRSLVHL